jgi:membrane fusion protein, multidrug efflux system
MFRRSLIILLAALALPGCKRDSAAADRGLKESDPDAPVPVETVTLETGTIEDTLRLSATLHAEMQVQVLSRTAGQVTARAAEEGDVVKAGAVLVRIEADEQSAAITRIDSDLAVARTNYERQKKLHGQGVVSEQSLENAKAEVDRLELARRDASRSLGHTVVKAPIGGTVTRRLVKFGDLVVPNQPLYEIVQLDTLVADVFVPEKDVHKVTAGGVARLSSPSSGQALPDGRVERIAPIVDPRSGTVKVTIDLPDDAALRPGMFVDVHLVVASDDDALLLPRQALVYDNDQPYAFKLVDGDKVERVAVEIAIEDRDSIKPAGGFAAGDRVVVAGQIGLKDGAQVEASAAPGSSGADSAGADKGAGAGEAAGTRAAGKGEAEPSP